MDSEEKRRVWAALLLLVGLLAMILVEQLVTPPTGAASFSGPELVMSEPDWL